MPTPDVFVPVPCAKVAMSSSHRHADNAVYLGHGWHQCPPCGLLPQHANTVYQY